MGRRTEGGRRYNVAYSDTGDSPGIMTDLGCIMCFVLRLDIPRALEAARGAYILG